MHVQREDRKLQLARINQLAILVIIAFAVLVGRLWYLQIVLGESLLQQSESNRTKLLRARAPRGTIYDRKGRILATSRPQFVVLAVPDVLKENKEALKTLCGILQITPADLDEIISKDNPRPGSPVRVKVDVPMDVVARISELRMRLPGVSVELDQLRYYPDGPAVAHIMGHLGEINEKELEASKAAGKDYRPGDYVGKAGLEEQYENELKGTDGGKQIEVNATGRVVRMLEEKPSKAGMDLRLTIDRDLQIAGYRALGKQVGAAVAIDPRDGAVLAMVSNPSYDPNLFVKRFKQADWDRIILNKAKPMQNRCVYNVYPPGSTFKPVMAIAGLVNRMCNPNTTVSCNRSYYLGRAHFGDWKAHGGGVNFNRAIAESCDVWFYNLGHRLEIDRIAAMSRQFGLGKATGIDLPFESRRKSGGVGTVPDTKWKREVLHERWWPGETISCSIGQGFIQTSPLQQAVMCATVANGGKVYRPFLVREIDKPGENVVSRTTARLNGKVKATIEDFKLVQDAMRRTVTNGTGKVCDIQGMSVCGKTGSAENSGPAHGWFISFAPLENPRIAVVCIVEHGRHGATTAAPVCRAILDVYFGKKKPQDIGSGNVRVSGD